MKAFSMKGNDLDFDGKQFVTISGIEQLAQEAELSVGITKGEWFLDEEEGMDRSSFTQKPFNMNEFRSDLITSLQGTTSTLSVTKLELFPDYSTRKCDVIFEAVTEENELLQVASIGVSI